MNVQQFVGMKIEAAKVKAKAAGFEVKTKTTGIQTLNNEHRVGRINFKVVDGVVVSAHVG
jgi:hypothetical protein